MSGMGNDIEEYGIEEGVRLFEGKESRVVVNFSLEDCTETEAQVTFTPKVGYQHWPEDLARCDRWAFVAFVEAESCALVAGEFNIPEWCVEGDFNELISGVFVRPRDLGNTFSEVSAVINGPL